jgi:Secretion system C-terminal sorting domain
VTVRLLRDDGKAAVELPFIELTKNNIYPNPSQGIFNLEIELNKEVKILVSLCSLDGKLIESREVNIKDGIIEFDVRSFAPGMYILKLIMDRDVRSTRFVKL